MDRSIEIHSACLGGSDRNKMVRREYLLRNTLGINDLFKHVDHVEELTVDVSNDDDGLFNAQHIRLTP